MTFQIENIYQILKEVSPDPYIENKGYVILKPHQIVPKIYVYSTNVNSFIVNAGTGTGKSLAALYFLIEKIRIAKLNLLNRNLNLNRPLFIGPWSSKESLFNEMTRKQFNLYHGEYPKTTEARNKLFNKFGRFVDYYGYQSLFNIIFPYYFQHNIQDVKILENEWKNGKLRVNNEYLEYLRDNYIAVDEVQNLYSLSGLNTYGFTFKYLMSIASELNLKVIYFTGTLFNSSITELSYVLSIMNGETYPIEENFDSKIVLDDELIYTPKPDFLNLAINELSNKYMYYSKSIMKNNYKLKSFLGPTPGIYHENADQYLYFSNENTKDYPSEYKIGNTVISDSLILYQLKAQGYQLEALKKININNLDISYENSTENSTKLSPYDIVLPSNYEWKKQDIHYSKITSLFTGSFLERKNISKYSALGAFIIDLSLFNAFIDEKTVIFHDQIKNFGLLQYGKILEINGLVQCGNMPVSNSICKKCQKRFDQHTSKSNCEKFKPIYFDYLYGSQTHQERDYIINTFRSPNNLYGDLISVLLISEVATTGLSLTATNNLAIISRVSNISKIEQIQARIIRMRSHMSLPPSKRHVKLYLMGVSPTIDENSYFYKYYKLRQLREEGVQKFLDKLIPKSIGTTLLKYPNRLELSKEEKKLTSEVYFNDGSEIFENIDKIVMQTLRTNIWGLNLIMKRIKNTDKAISYLDLSKFPDDYIKYYILKNPDLQTCNYPNENTSESIFIKNKIITTNDSFENKNILYTNLISNDYELTIDAYKSIIETSKSDVSQFKSFAKLMETLSLLNDFSYLVGWKYFWDTYVYKISSEFYEDDENNFVSNHASKNRNKNFTGVYYDKNIIKKDGSIVPITYKFVKTIPHKHLGKIFNISASNGLKINISVQTNFDDENFDKRSIKTGLECKNYIKNDIQEYYKLTNVSKIEYCFNLLGKICEDQLTNNQRFIVTPFERNSIL